MTIDKKVEILEKIVREHHYALKYVQCDPRACEASLIQHLAQANELIHELDADAEDAKR